jgi:hypothetical protein
MQFGRHLGYGLVRLKAENPAKRTGLLIYRPVSGMSCGSKFLNLRQFAMVPIEMNALLPGC